MIALIIRISTASKPSEESSSRDEIMILVARLTLTLTLYKEIFASIDYLLELLVD
jgi:hypothetical protein